MSEKLVKVLAVTVLLGVAAEARAQQNPATVTKVQQVVKTAKGNSPTLTDAKPGQGLAAGDRVRTASRSAAELTFQDKSLLRMGELTEVVVTSPSKRDTKVLRGKVFADYKAPGSISGGYAVAAVRGTQVEIIVDDSGKNAIVRCYHGRVFVGASDNPVSAGSTTQVTGTSLIDPQLVGSATDWVGGEVRFVDGPYVGQKRTIRGFDAATGSVQFGPALPAAGAQPDAISGYLMVKNPKRQVVELLNNQGTRVQQGKDPSAPKTVPHVQFAGLDRNSYVSQLAEGNSSPVFAGSSEQHNVQEESVTQREAINRVTQGTPPAQCGGAPLPPGALFQRRGLSAALGTRFAQDTGGMPPTREDIVLPQNVQPGSGGGDQNEHVAFLFEPFFITSNDTDVIGSRLRMQASQGDAYIELGYRYTHSGKLFDGVDQHDVSEGFLQLKGKSGSVVAGRQHLFLGPVNNNDIATLMGLETTDAIIYQLPLKNGYKQYVGYVFDSKALRPGGFRGGYARGQMPLFKGNAGYALIAPTDDKDHFGFSVDASQPLLPKKVDVYGELGEDTHGRRVTTAGIYLPGIYHKYKIDVYTEYSVKEGADERVSFRIRKQLPGGFLAQLFMDDRMGNHHVVGGAALMWTLKFH